MTLNDKLTKRGRLCVVNGLPLPVHESHGVHGLLHALFSSLARERVISGPVHGIQRFAWFVPRVVVVLGP